jgi:ABC-type branched-subunit amino acid transport system substrate-binding protein
LVVRDSEAPGGAVKAVDELAAAGVVGILGAPIEATARAAGARAAELRVPFVALTSGSGLSDPARGLFRLFTDAEVDAAAVAGYAVGARGVKKFALLVPDNDYGRRMARAFRDGLARAGAPPDAVVAEVTYGDAVTAFAPEVAKLPAAGWEALFVPDSARRVALIAPALASAGFWAGGPDTPAPKKGRVVLLLLASVGARPELLATSSRYVERALAAVSFHASDSAPETKAFVARWRATEAGADPDVAAAYGYDAAALLGALGASARGARNEVAAALGRLHDAPGLTGPLAAQPDGTLRGPSRIVEVRGESFVVLGKI